MIRVLRSPALAALHKPTVAIMLFVFSSFFATPSFAQTAAPQEAVSTSNDGVPSSVVQIPISSNFYSPYAFVVDKKARMLTVWQQTDGGLKKIASFPADMGKNNGAKQKRNDHKTPEGIYFLLEKREGAGLDFSQYGKRAFTTDYPNYFDRVEGKTGDGIWLHAVPDTVPLTRGSRGCVVVRNEVILDISQYVKLGRTPILIQEQIDTVPVKDMAQTSQEINQWLESWRQAWETKNIEKYMEHYAPEFRSMSMNKKQWQAYKDRLAKAYKSIGVRLSKPAIFLDRNRAIVRFLQEYNSNMHADVGEKTLFLKKTSAGYRILSEVWAEESSQLARQEIEANHTTAVSCSTGKDCVRTNALINN